MAAVCAGSQAPYGLIPFVASRSYGPINSRWRSNTHLYVAGQLSTLLLTAPSSRNGVRERIPVISGAVKQQEHTSLRTYAGL